MEEQLMDRRFCRDFGGLHPKLDLDWFCEMLRGLKQRYPEVHLKALTMVEIAFLARRAKVSIRETLVNLGLNPEMLPTITFGEENPADPGHNDTAFSKNRRGELILLSPPGSN